ncbi:hypothetical protein AAVH_16974 [Aphelenchoides avenae]|nr:hypothetical protein AAVH_16974 [Aphelenchus avenae]
MFPEEMDDMEIYNEVLQLFNGEPSERFNLRPLDNANLASIALVPAQPEQFQVPRHPSPHSGPFDPFHECDGDDEDDDYFHRPVALAKLVTNRRWKNQRGISGIPQMQSLLSRVKRLKVRSLAQMTLLRYISRLRGNDFLYEVLTANDLRNELPRLLMKYKPLLTDTDTENPWPSRKDFRNALNHWCCYCAHACRYVMDHLSGPIHFDPNWFLDEDVDPEVRENLVDSMLDDHRDVIHDLRHQAYRQYGHAHIEAIRLRVRVFDWERFDDEPRLKVPLDRVTEQPTVVFLDQYIWDCFSPSIRNDVQLAVIDLTNRDDVIQQVRRYFPHSKTTRVIFWFGPDYLLRVNKGFCYVLASLCYHYTKYFGFIEQYVVLPTYVRQKRNDWTHSVLETFAQRQQILPYARVAIGPQDLRLWERDERELKDPGKLRDWDSLRLGEDGHYLDERLIESTKTYLVKYHDLDLWADDDALSEATPPATSPTATSTSASDHRHTSSASASAPALDYDVPSTSDLRTYSVPDINVRAVAASVAEDLTHEGATPEERALIASTVQHISDKVLSKAAIAALKVMQPKLENIKKLGQQQRSPKKSETPKDSRSGPRKDQDKDRQPRK